MCLVGMINPPDKNLWIEINSQILNALFTLNAFLTQPERLVLLKDSITYYQTKDEALCAELVLKVPRFAPKRSFLLWIAVIALNLQCIFQYPIAVAMWAWSSTARPPLIIPIFLPLSFLSGIVGGVLTFQKPKTAANCSAATIQ